MNVMPLQFVVLFMAEVFENESAVFVEGLTDGYRFEKESENEVKDSDKDVPEIVYDALSNNGYTVVDNGWPREYTKRHHEEMGLGVRDDKADDLNIPEGTPAYNSLRYAGQCTLTIEIDRNGDRRITEINGIELPDDPRLKTEW